MGHYNKINNKILTLGQALEKVKALKETGQKVVFTNGCFDIIHPGHVDYLAKAADLGDFLIVAANTDESVSKLKGPTRPINEEESRAIVLAALESVSAVILFSEPTPFEVISLLKPDVLVKGGDYTVDTIVGSDIVLANGGTVLTIPFREGYSTSATEERILKAHSAHPVRKT